MVNQKVDTIIIGSGQAGLSLSYYLRQAGREYQVLEKADRPGDAWRNRWDSFTLVTPNWCFKLPGAEYNGPDPHAFMPKAEVVNRFERYVEDYQLPVRFGVTVRSVEQASDGKNFIVHANGDSWQTRNVVVATGFYQQGKVPAFASEIPAEMHQIESGKYRNPQALEPGAVLVVGSGQSGAQIAEELNQAGRKVYLSVGGAGRIPMRYRGRDAFEWMVLTGFYDRTADQFPFPAHSFVPPMLTGKDGGRALNPHIFFRQGITLLGHLKGYEDGCLHFAPDLQASLAKSEQFQATQLKMVDAFIEKNGLDAPAAEPLDDSRDASKAPDILVLDLNKAGISTIIWAAGYRADYSLVRFPVIDADGYPLTHGGVTQVPGLYFTGMPWMDTLKTGQLVGAGESAARLAEHIQ